MSYNPDNPSFSPKRDRARVLVIDDDPTFRNLLAAILRSKYLISVASDGLAGLQKVKEYPPDIAITDVQMPGLDGLQTLAAIRKDPTLSRLWVIMLTGDASRETVLAAVRSGADDYLIKTALSKEEVLRKIDRLLQRERSEAKPVSLAPPASSYTNADRLATAGATDPHHPSSIRSMVTAPGMRLSANSDSGEILTATLAGDSHADQASVDQSHLQEILDSWD
jgi:DNA-binding response OmpR family regulator